MEETMLVMQIWGVGKKTKMLEESSTLNLIWWSRRKLS